MCSLGYSQNRKRPHRLPPHQTTEPAARRARTVDAETARAGHEQQQEAAGDADVLPEMDHHVALQGGVGDIPEIVAQHRCRHRVHGHDQRERAHLEADDQQQAAERLDRGCNRRGNLHERHALRMQVADKARIAQQFHHTAPQKQHGKGDTCDEDNAGIDGTRHEGLL